MQCSKLSCTFRFSLPTVKGPESELKSKSDRIPENDRVFKTETESENGRILGFPVCVVSFGVEVGGWTENNRVLRIFFFT